MIIYFDNASTMQVFPEVKKFVSGNAGFLNADRNVYHQAGVQTAAEIEKSRIVVANILNVSPANIKFLCDESILLHLISNYLSKSAFSSIITYKHENPILLDFFRNVAERNNLELHFVSQMEDSGIDLKHLKQLLKESKKSFVSLPHVNAVTGRLLQIKRVSELCKKYDAIFHCDISYSIGRLGLDMSHISVDIASFSSQKTGAIRGVTGVFIRYGQNIDYKDICFQENQNIYALGSLLVALKIWGEKASEFNFQIKKLKKYLFEKLNQANIDYNSISESDEHFSPYLINIAINVSDFEAFCYKLDLNDVQISPFFKDKEILISFSPMNTFDDIDRFVEVCKKIVS